MSPPPFIPKIFQQLRESWRGLPMWLRRLSGMCAFLVLMGLIALAIIWHHYASLAATYDMAALTRGQNETLIVDAQGEPIGSASEIEREIVTLQDVPILLVQAIIATEDARFSRTRATTSLGCAVLP